MDREIAVVEVFGSSVIAKNMNGETLFRQPLFQGLEGYTSKSVTVRFGNTSVYVYNERGVGRSVYSVRPK